MSLLIRKVTSYCKYAKHMFMRPGCFKAPQKCKQMQFCCQKDEEEMVPDWKQTSPAKWERTKACTWDVQVPEKLDLPCQHCLRSGVEAVADILGELLSSHTHVCPFMASLLHLEPQCHHLKLHLSPACPGDGRAGATPANPGPWTGPRVKHRQYMEFPVADGLG